MSGIKGRSGRKTNGEIVLARELMDAVVEPAQWKRIFRRLARLAEKGEARTAVQAFRVLSAYRFGMPAPKEAGEQTAAPISIIEYAAPEERERGAGEQAADGVSIIKCVRPTERRRGAGSG